MAGLIPQQFINDLLDRTDIVEVIDSRVSLRKTGRNYSALCPFHNEKSPSFSVNPDKQFYYCFGCGAGGNVLSFLMEYERLDFRDAVEDLARRAGLEIPEERAIDPKAEKLRKSLYAHLDRAQRFYQHQLRKHSERDKAINYLKNRGLSGEIAKQFLVGYAPPGWDNLHQTLVSSTDDEQQLIEGGMLIKKDNGKGSYDRFRDRIIFPIRDSRGRTIAFGGRVLGDEKPKYLNSPESPIFHKGRELYGLYEAKQANRNLERVLIVEGYMDVVALAQFGITYAVATLGTATSDTHLTKLFRQVSEVIFCFDGDQAGRQAASRALDNALPLMEDGRQIRFLFLPEGEDPDSLVRSEGKDAFEQRLDSAQPLTDYFFDSIARNINTGALDGKARLAKLALDKMQAMPRGLLYQMMVDQLAKLTEMDGERLRDMSPDDTRAKASSSAAPAAQTGNEDGNPPPEAYYLDQAPPPSQGNYDDYGSSFHDSGFHGSDSRNSGFHSGSGSGFKSKGKPGFKRNTAPQPRADVLPMAKQAACILLHHPHLAGSVEDIEALAGVDAADMYLLTELLRLLKTDPQMTMGHVIGHFAGLDAQEEIAQLSAIELVLPQAELETQFHDAVNALNSQQLEARVQALLSRSNQADFSTEERTELKQLLQQKSEQLSGQKTSQNK